MSDPSPDDLLIYHYDPTPAAPEPAIMRLKAGDRVFAVTRNTGDPDHPTVGDQVTIIPMMVGVPPTQVPPSRWARFRGWVTRRPVPATGEFTIQWTTSGPGPTPLS